MNSFIDVITAIVAALLAGIETSVIIGILRIPGRWWGWIIIAILTIFLLMFFNSLYQAGGAFAFLTVSIILFIVAYVAAGPYSAYTEKYTTEFTSSMNTGFTVMSEKLSDMELLLTDPIAYQAKMQQRNVQADREVKPQFIEITDMSPLLNPVPNGSMAITQVIVSNVASSEEMVTSMAKNVTLIVSCTHCTMESPVVFNFGNMKPHEKKMVTINTTTASDRIPGNMFFKYNLSYELPSSSNLYVEETSENYIEQMLQSGNKVFKNVLATSSVGPAAISLNVGKQPVISDGTPKILLVNIINMDNIGKVIIPSDAVITLKIPNTLMDASYGIKCDAADIWSVSSKDSNGYEVVEIKPTKTLDMRSISKAPIYCHFVPKKIESHGAMPVPNTGLITASISKYIYQTTTSQSIEVTYPLVPIENENGGGGGGSSGGTTIDINSIPNAKTTVPNDKNNYVYIPSNSANVYPTSLYIPKCYVYGGKCEATRASYGDTIKNELGCDDITCGCPSNYICTNIQSCNLRCPLDDSKSIYMTSGFGCRNINGMEFHPGVDLVYESSYNNVYATASGILYDKFTEDNSGGYGNMIVLANGCYDNRAHIYFTIYGHLSSFATSNWRVSKGDIIGHMGSTGKSTGKHLHYEIRENSNGKNSEGVLEIVRPPYGSNLRNPCSLSGGSICGSCDCKSECAEQGISCGGSCSSCNGCKEYDKSEKC